MPEYRITWEQDGRRYEAVLPEGTSMSFHETPTDDFDEFLGRSAWKVQPPERWIEFRNIREYTVREEPMSDVTRLVELLDSLTDEQIAKIKRKVCIYCEANAAENNIICIGHKRLFQNGE